MVENFKFSSRGQNDCQIFRVGYYSMLTKLENMISDFLLMRILSLTLNVQEL